jgi:hypothetical protein
VNKESQFETFITQVIQKVKMQRIEQLLLKKWSLQDFYGRTWCFVFIEQTSELFAAGSMSGAVDMNIYMLNPEGIERTKTLFGPILGDKLHLSCV